MPGQQGCFIRINPSIPCCCSGPPYSNCTCSRVHTHSTKISPISPEPQPPEGRIPASPTAAASSCLQRAKPSQSFRNPGEPPRQHACSLPVLVCTCSKSALLFVDENVTGYYIHTYSRTNNEAGHSPQSLQSQHETRYRTGALHGVPAIPSTPPREGKSLEKTRMAGVGVRASRRQQQQARAGGGPPIVIETRWRSENEPSWAAALPFLCFQSVTELNQEQLLPALSASTHPLPPPFFPSPSAGMGAPTRTCVFPIRTCICCSVWASAVSCTPVKKFREHFPAAHARHLTTASSISHILLPLPHGRRLRLRAMIMRSVQSRT